MYIGNWIFGIDKIKSAFESASRDWLDLINSTRSTINQHSTSQVRVTQQQLSQFTTSINSTKETIDKLGQQLIEENNQWRKMTDKFLKIFCGTLIAMTIIITGHINTIALLPFIILSGTIQLIKLIIQFFLNSWIFLLVLLILVIIIFELAKTINEKQNHILLLEKRLKVNKYVNEGGAALLGGVIGLGLGLLVARK